MLTIILRMAKILYLEDDLDLARSVMDYLAAKHYLVEHCTTAGDATLRLKLSDFDVLVLDWNVPDGTGLDVLREFRGAGGRAPALMLTARDTIDDKQSGFSAGSDDYLTKPFDMRELLMRIEALQRRPSEVIPSNLQSGNVQLNAVTKEVLVDGVKVDLNPKEFALLEFLMKRPGQVFSLEALLNRLWSTESASTTEAVAVTLKRMRKKLDNTGAANIIENVFGVGYKVRE